MTSHRNPRAALLAVVVLAALAAANGVYLMLVHIDYVVGVDTVAGACYEFAEHGCAVTAGRFGSIAGIPVAAIGFAGACATLACGLAALRGGERMHDPYRSLLLGLTGFSVLASVVMGIFSILEGSFCPFCVIWYGLNAALFAGAWFARNRDLHPTDLLDDVTSNAGFLALGVFGAALLVAVLWHHNRLDTALAAQAAEIEAKAPEFAADILEKNKTLSTPPARDIRMMENPTKFIGDASADEADVVIVEFGDFECPHCKKLWESMEVFLDETDLNVRMHFAHYPLNSACNPGVNDLHPSACQAAVAGVCAEKQGKFWAYGSKVFANQHDLDRSDLVGYAEEVGLDKDAFQTCLDDPRSMAKVKYDIALGNTVELPATPTFYVNGYGLTGAFPPPVLSELVKAIVAHDAK